MGLFKVPLWITLFSLLAGISACLFYRLRDNARMANCFLAGMIVAILIAAHLALSTFSPVLSSAILAEAIKPEVHPGDIVVVNASLESVSSFAFYLESPVLLLATSSAPDGSEPASPCKTAASPPVAVTIPSVPGPPPTPTGLVDRTALCGLWQSPQRVWLWTRSESAPQLPGGVYLIGRSGGKEILSNQPNTGGASF
jgi:hypothetical protein